MEEDDFISKSQRKRDMTRLQELGAALVKLAPEQLARIDMPESLREAVLACRRFTKHEAVRRQMQYIGRIMRDLDAGPIAQQLERMHAPSRMQTALFHRAEQWRDEILADPAAGVTRFVMEFPEADPQRLRSLAGSAQAERAAERAPKHYRELFHLINQIVQHHARGK
jgi:ribosome-associated protein